MRLGKLQLPVPVRNLAVQIGIVPIQLPQPTVQVRELRVLFGEIITSVVLFLTVRALNYLGDAVSRRFGVRESVL